MRSAGNFHPEWGYLAPAPSFMRTLRIALVATAIGATAGAAVVVSLVARPASRTADSSIAAHALVAAVPAANAASGNAAAAAAAPAPVQSIPAPAPAAAVGAAPLAAVAPQQSGAPADSAGAGANPANAAPPPSFANASNSATGAAPGRTAHIEEPAAAPGHDDGALTPEGGANKKPAVRKHRVAGYETMRRWQSKKPRRDERGFAPLFRLFSARGGSLFSTN